MAVGRSGAGRVAGGCRVRGVGFVGVGLGRGGRGGWIGVCGGDAGEEGGRGGERGVGERWWWWGGGEGVLEVGGGWEDVGELRWGEVGGDW